jgi:hypothetical protein
MDEKRMNDEEQSRAGSSVNKHKHKARERISESASYYDSTAGTQFRMLRSEASVATCPFWVRIIALSLSLFLSHHRFMTVINT